MTKQEAIEELTRAAELCPTTPLAEACRMALEALDNGVANAPEVQMDERTKAKGEMVADAPTVDAVPARHRKWVDENGNRPYGYRFNWLCSECGRPQHTSTAKLLKEFEEEHRWCHFCGARMDGKDGEPI